MVVPTGSPPVGSDETASARRPPTRFGVGATPGYRARPGQAHGHQEFEGLSCLSAAFPSPIYRAEVRPTATRAKTGVSAKLLDSSREAAPECLGDRAPAAGAAPRSTRDLDPGSRGLAARGLPPDRGGVRLRPGGHQLARPAGREPAVPGGGVSAREPPAAQLSRPARARLDGPRRALGPAA